MNSLNCSRPRVALFEPRIPQNTGTIGRSCLAFKMSLDIIKPTGFSFEDKYLKRAGLDYWPLVTVNQYENFEKFLASKSTKRIISFSKKNGLYLKDFKFKQDDILLFGREDSGLPDSIIDKSDFLISIFMPNLQTGTNDQKGVRSLNLSVACGIAIYEAHKQINFQNGN